MSNDLQERLARLSPEKRELLLKQLHAQKANAASTASARRNVIPRAVRSGPLPLSYAQQRLWFLEQLTPGSTAYNMGILYRLTGALNVAALEQSLGEIVQRHETLRTTFGWHADQPVQIIHAAAPLDFKVIHVDAAPADREATIRKLIAHETGQPFDLERGPLFRSLLLRLSANEHCLLLNMHHIISDEWSIGVLSRELTSLYRAFSMGQAAALPELPVQYADYAVWQRDWLSRGPLAAQQAYWKEQLSDLPLALVLPTDRPAPAVQSLRGDHHWFEFSPELSANVKAFSQREGVTLFMVLQAAFQTVLYRYTGQSDLVIGSPIANRTRTEIEPLIGFFVNTLVLRTDLSGKPTFREVLRRVRETTLNAYTHQDLPFEILVEELHPDRSLSHNPLFQVMFAMESEAAPLSDWPDLKIETIEIENDTSKFDLTLTLSDQGSRLSGRIEYRTDLFDSATIARLAGHLETLLAAAIAQPDRPITALPLLTTAEQHQLQIEWNATARDYPPVSGVHELIEAQAARTPDALAVVYADEHLTYAELNRRANQLAHHLRKSGVGPNVLVGICVERSCEMIISLLSVLKAGGAYVPLDPTYPPDRLAFMLANANVPVVLTHSKVLGHLAESRSSTICLDTDWPTIASESADNPIGWATPADLNYVIYTSGSTGRPKGAGVYRNGFVNLLNWFVRDFTLNVRDSVLLTSSFSFDLTQKNFYAPLMVGGVLRLLPSDFYDPAQILRSIDEGQVTWLNCTPSAFYPLLDDEADPAYTKLRSLHWVFLGGEPISMPRLMSWLHSANCAAEVVNTYGPTECTDICAFARLTPPDQFLDRPIPLGKPIDNAQIYVLDQNLQPLPVGSVGELCVAGAGVGFGYLNDVTLTLTKFLPDPFSRHAGARLYKTGDLVRYWPDGNLEFIGRVDHQVKIRGFRIELGEIEAVLSQHPAVRDTVVVAHEDQAGDKRLAAYVATRHPVTASELRQHVQAKLSEYMTPSGFVLMEALPLTPNGKVDRKALPAWQPDQPTPSETFAAPRTPLEELIADVWSQVLGIQRIGLHDSFFELGGHSLLATQVVARLRQALGYEVAVRAIFEYPTLASLAASLEARLQVENPSRPPTIERGPRDQPLPLSFAQEQLWLIDQITPGNIAYNIPLVLQLQGVLNVAALHASLNEIVRRHEVLRTTFVLEAGQPVQMIAPASAVPLPLLDVSEVPAVEVTQRLRDYVRQPFDLAHGPLLRTALFKLGENDYRLSVTVHHSVFDGWSSGIFVTELWALYQAQCADQPSPLRKLPVQYADFAVQQRAWLHDAELEKQLAYWKRQLADAPALLDLPLDRPRPPVQSFQGCHHPIVLVQPLSDKLKAVSRREHVTPFMLLLTAFAALLQRYTGQDDFVVGTPVANRNWPEVESVIGYFVNVLALRTDLSGDPPLRALIGQVRDIVLNAHAHQDVPFVKLVEALRPERDLSYNPLFQVMFSATPFMLEPQLPDLTSHVIELETGIYQSADLHLDLEESTEGFVGSIGYNTDLFEAATIARLMSEYIALLDRLTAADADLDRPVSEWLSFIPARKRVPASTAPAAQPQPADVLAQRRQNLANRRTNLSDAQRALFEKRLRGE